MPKPVRLPRKEEVAKEKLNQPQTDRIIKSITFFGDSAVPEDSQIYQDVWHTAKLLAENGFGIVNGGGPGVMQAATDGAESVDGHTVAVYWEPKMASIFEGKNISNVTDESEAYSNYMMRTLGLIERGQVYVVCKGGTGTVSELGMVWALAKLYFGKHKPVILFGDFWPPLIDSLQKYLNIDEQELGVLYYADTKEEVLELVMSFEAEIEMRTQRKYEGDEAAFLVSSQVGVTKQSYNKVAKQYHRERVGSLVAGELLDQFIKYVNPPAKVLDVGCGAGYDLGYLAQKYTVTGIDSSEELVEIARFENPSSEVILSDILTADIPQNTYKGIWARDILHHIGENDQDYVFQKLADALVDGGTMLAVVREGEGEGTEEETRSGYSLKRFYHYFSETELVDRARKAGLELVELKHSQRSHKWLVGIFRKTS